MRLVQPARRSFATTYSAADDRVGLGERPCRGWVEMQLLSAAVIKTTISGRTGFGPTA